MRDIKENLITQLQSIYDGIEEGTEEWYALSRTISSLKSSMVIVQVEESEPHKMQVPQMTGDELVFHNID